MNKFVLNEKHVNELRAAHRAERNRHSAYKINAVILLGTGWKLKNVKQALLLDDETLRSYVEKYGSSEKFVILDNAKYHYSQEVREVIEQSSRLKLVCLPTYSPELNLIDRVWRFFKKKVLYNKYYEDLDSFRKASITFFRKFSNYTDELESLLGGGFEGF